MGKRRMAIVATVLMIGLGACAASEATVGTAPEYEHFDFSLVKEYGSLEELATDTSLVVRGAPVSVERIEHEGIPYQLVTFEPAKVIEGEDPGESIIVRQLYGLVDGLAVPMQAGREYLLFLRPFEFVPGEDTGQWYVVGPGQWVQEGDQFILAVDESHLGGIPATLEAEQADTVLEE